MEFNQSISQSNHSDVEAIESGLSSKLLERVLLRAVCGSVNNRPVRSQGGMEGEPTHPL
jgi:hypothetical protein